MIEVRIPDDTDEVAAIRMLQEAGIPVRIHTTFDPYKGVKFGVLRGVLTCFDNRPTGELIYRWKEANEPQAAKGH